MPHIKKFFHSIPELVVIAWTFCIISVNNLVISHIYEMSPHSEFNYYNAFVSPPRVINHCWAPQTGIVLV